MKTRIILIVHFLILTFLTLNAQDKKYNGYINDTHVHLRYESESPYRDGRTALPKDLIRNYNQSKYKRVGVIVMAPTNNIEKTKAQNDSVIAFCKRHSKFYPICSVHPNDEKLALDEIERLAKLGVKFLKLHSITQDFDVASSNVSSIVQKCTENKMIILFDGLNPFDPAQNGKFLMLALQNPESRMIIAHMGGADFHDFAILIALNKLKWFPQNIWFDLSGISDIYADSPYEDQIVWTCRKIGIEHILYGSDFPYTTPEDAITDTQNLGFTDDELSKIFYENSEKLFNSFKK
ncbi:MAG: amidohydrolase family protein [Fidelibacterota bacterium]|nr:MAG: amidohydrolase family protein [Candidatus Neomarinimicrobiota bacterium]